MRRLIAIVALALAGPVHAECTSPFAPPSVIDPGGAPDLFAAGLAAMRADRMDDAEHLLLSSYARLGDAPDAAALEPQVMARLVEVAIQRHDPTTAMVRMKVLHERLRRGGAHPAWIDAVLRYADNATQAQQDAEAGRIDFGGCRALGLAVRTAARILFDTDSAQIDDHARAQIAGVAHNLAQSGAGHIVVRGHTDARGSDSWNEALSRRRAAAVAAQIVAIEPVLAGKLSVEGAGKREPLYPGDDAETWRLNRRVEFVLSK
jgi:outer membrane protein OmpA-like peptidoglycan-associated protein